MTRMGTAALVCSILFSAVALSVICPELTIVFDSASPANYTVDNRRPLKWVIIHAMSGTYSGTIQWFKDPATRLSAHYLISRTGQITQMVGDNDTAWHAGNWSYNQSSIGIELEDGAPSAYLNNPAWATDALYAAAAKLVRCLVDQYGISMVHPSGTAPSDPQTGSGIIGHNQVPGTSKQDPGPYWDWVRFMNLVSSGTCGYSVGQGTSGAELTAFQNAFNRAGGQSVLGCPNGAVRFDGFTSFRGTVGHYQTFQNGAIEYHANGQYAGRAFPIVNPLYNKWVSFGFTSNHPLGYPIADLSSQSTSCYGTSLRYQVFEGGALEHHLSGSRSGQVYEVHGAIYTKWGQKGYAGCPLGLPTSDERDATRSPQGSTGRVSDFEGGHIHWRTGAAQAYESHGAIDALYVSMGGSGSWLGFPISDEYVASTGFARSDFEGGYITTTDGVNYRAFPYGETISPPSTPSGPTSGTVGVSYSYSTGGASSNQGHPVQYWFDWGDGTSSSWLAVGVTSASHSWSSSGTYTVRVKARCASHTSVESGWSSGLTVSITVPETVSAPSTPSGPTSGTVGVSYSYSTGGASSNQGHPVQYWFDWGDGTSSSWLAVGVTSASHSWSSSGTYTVRVKARCASHTSVESGWSGGLTVNLTVSGAVSAFLRSPLPQSPYEAPISSVFDHSISGAIVAGIPRVSEYSKDQVVQAYTGERGTVAPISDCYRQPNGAAFDLGAANYTGISSLGNTYLCYDGHPGYDYRVSEGTDVYAAAAGVVIEAQCDGYDPGGNCTKGLGYYIKVDHGNGFHTLYGHLSQLLVRVNDSVSAGQLIGKSGNSGASTGAHLHFQVRQVSLSGQVSVDPYGWNGADVLWTGSSCSYTVGQGTSGAELSAFQNAFNRAGGQSVLGCPNGAVRFDGFTSFRGTVGHYQTFQNGAIEYHANGQYAGQAFPIVNPLYNKWVSFGFTSNHPLGYPIADLSSQSTSCYGTSLRYQVFEGGALEHHLSGSRSGQVYEVHGAIYTKWGQKGYAACPLGLPTSDERDAGASPQGSTGRVSDFEGGHIHWRTGAGEAYESHGAIDAVYVSMGGSGSWLGFPISDEYVASTGFARSDFEGGYITTTDGVNYRAFPYGETISPPSTPSGPTSGTVGVSYSYSTGGASSNQGHPVQYWFDWGDGTSSSWLAVGVTSASHSWSSSGTYTVRVKARCASHTSVESGWSSGLTVSITVPETVSAPSTPSGPTSGTVGVSYVYSTGGASSNQGHPVQYWFDWGDGTSSSWLAVGVTSASHSWSSSGTYTVRVKARCASHTSVESGWSSGLTVSITVPETVSAPSTPSGPTSGTVGVSYSYSTGGASSNQGHPVQYWFDWGDGTSSSWLAVGVTSASHSWSSSGTYTVRVKARCATHTSVESLWSQTLTVTVTQPGGAPPANDEPAGATLISSLPYSTTQDTRSATSNPADPVHSCTAVRDSNTVWFSYMASFTGRLVVNTFGSDYDTVLSAYPGRTAPGAELVCNDDTAGRLQSQISFSVSSGQWYLIQVSNFGSPGGGRLVLNVNRERTPTAVFRDTYGGIRLTREGSSMLFNGGGLFASDPEAAQNANGDTFVVARDNYNALWANVFDASTSTWRSWTSGGGVIQGRPAIAVATSGTAFIAARDNWNSYWLTSYTAGGAFGSWTYLAGIFSTDPVIAACGDGSVYLVGKDNWGSLWSGRYVPGSGFRGWVWGQGIVKGNPSVTCGSDNVAYVTARDNWDSLWMARVQGNSWLGWSYGGGIMSADPQVAAAGNGTVYAVIQDTGGVVWYRGYTEGTANGWQAWRLTNGVLQTGSPATANGELYVVGRDWNNDLWWYRATGSQWTQIGSRGIPAGRLAAAPR